MQKIYIYSKAWCPFCSLLKAELNARGFAYTEIDMSNYALRQQFYAMTGTNTVPQLFISETECSATEPTGTRIGGWDVVNADWDALEIAR